MSNSDKYSLVKKAAKLDLDTDSGYVEFLNIAKESGGRYKNYTRFLNGKEIDTF